MEGKVKGEITANSKRNTYNGTHNTESSSLNSNRTEQLTVSMFSRLVELERSINGIYIFNANLFKINNTKQQQQKKKHMQPKGLMNQRRVRIKC